MTTMPVHQQLRGNTLVKCQHCGKESYLISRALNLCLDCIRLHFDQVLPLIEEAHAGSRKPFALPAKPPWQKDGVGCKLCLNECHISPGGVSYCGLRTNEEQKLKGATADVGNVGWYHDALPTNCVADWVCPGGSEAGYPDFSHCPGPEFGYKNLAVFYQACSFNCLFCQNWQYRNAAGRGSKTGALQVASQVDSHTSCICYFGGDPTPQMPHSLRTSRLALERNRGRILRICWETNGSMHPALARQMAELSLDSGGCIKFDLKAWSEDLHVALCGVSNKRTLDNFRLLAEYIHRRPSHPLLVASTLLVPGYIDVEEVSSIAAFIADISPEIPYALLGFHPQFTMRDLPSTSRRHAMECLEAAGAAGLKKVRLGNAHLLGRDY